jgi:GNAT superfamily N-acetyltransferase
MEEQLSGGYRLSDDPARIDYKKVSGWLAGTYWVPGIGREEVERAARHSSLVIGAFAGDGELTGFARVVSDKTRFAYLMDVFVSESHRRKGLGRALIRFAMAHPEYLSVYQWLLATRDAHSVYGSVGFKPLAHPGRWMMNQRERPR